MKTKLRKVFYAGIIIIAIISVVLFSGCNKQIIGTNYSFNRAIIKLPDGSVISGKVDSWCDYGYYNMIRIKVEGVTYLVSSNNVILINDSNEEIEVND